MSGEQERQAGEQPEFDPNRLRGVLQRQEHREEQLLQLEEELRRREERFQQTAWLLGIPKERRDHPEVRRFIETRHAIEDAIHTLNSRPANWAQEAEETLAGAGLEAETPPAGEVLGPELRQRYDTASGLLNLVGQVLDVGTEMGHVTTEAGTPLTEEQGFKGDVLVKPLNRLLEPFHLSVAESPAGQDDKQAQP